MKKSIIGVLVFTVMSLFLLIPNAFAWDIVLHDNVVPQEYRLNLTNFKIGNNLVYMGKVARDGVEDQDCVLFFNPEYKEINIALLTNDDYYTGSFNGIWGQEGSFQWSHAGGFAQSGYSLFLGPINNGVEGINPDTASSAR